MTSDKPLPSILMAHPVQDGKITAFFVAGLDDNDASVAYCSTTKPVSRLRMIGAMAHALHAFNQGDQI